jgi:ABC-type sugar transport system permease subunit
MAGKRSEYLGSTRWTDIAKRRAVRRARGERSLGPWLIAPSLVLILGIVVYPLAYSLWISVHQMNLTNPDVTPYVGLDNYSRWLTSEPFWQSVGATTYFTVVSVVLTIVLGLLVALVLNQRFVGRRVVRALMLIPWALPSVVTGVIWLWIYNGNYGALNGLLLQLGLIRSYQTWLGDPTTALYAVVATKVWKELPFVALLLLATLQTIPSEVHEAGRVDGAGTLGTFFRITLPLLRPGLLVVAILETMWAFRVFDIVYVLTSGGPADATMVVAYLTYLETFKFLRFGSGAALAYVITLFIVLISFVYVRVLRSEVEY